MEKEFLQIERLTPEEETKLFHDVQNALVAANGGEARITSNFALMVFMQGTLLLRRFGVSREWFNKVLDGLEFAEQLVADKVPMGKFAGE